MKSFRPKPALSKNKHKPKAKRKRDSSWTRTSQAYRKANPICELCTQRSAVETHHVIPLSQGGELNDWSNLQALCHDCHRDQHKAD